ncbi:Histone chaperone [Cyphellophora attinorum]|uniref:Histone chaperone n=1 Tax=Cyphellophora attinorum TaxID=1664694 RepID=A0A0N1NX45_9EURO|nr:Histone chaperone [Phialophora attinorum]KPI37054.1 Histone chaperone [Phialophora attinorum]
MGLIAQAFDRDVGLYQKILLAIEQTPSNKQLFNDIAAFHLKYAQPASSAQIEETPDGPAAKKRKLDNGSVPIDTADVQVDTLLEMRDVSFSLPQRKKLHFRIRQINSPNMPMPMIMIEVINPATDQTEHLITPNAVAQVLKTPVPEKATKQYNYIFIPHPGTPKSIEDPILFTVPATAPKGGTYTFPDGASTLEDALSVVLQPYGLSLTLPDEKEFASATPEAHRKNEKAYHVKAFRGSKDGFLFFLSTGIFWGFKKPLLFMGLEDIESVSYTSVLQRTFNLNIAYRKPPTSKAEIDQAEAAGQLPEPEEIEFSMLDQSDYAGINEYVQRHGLHDASLAAGRRAKTVKKEKGTAMNGAGAAANGPDDEDDEDDGRTELEKAEAELQDAEDEEEEDFEPSDDDDDGSGSSGSEDDDEYEAERPTKKRKTGNLVQDELGSEAEDVEISDDEEDEEGDDEDHQGIPGVEGYEDPHAMSEIEEDEEGDEEEEGEEPEVLETPPPNLRAHETKVSMSMTQQQGRWGAAVNGGGEPDPDDDDQL